MPDLPRKPIQLDVVPTVSPAQKIAQLRAQPDLPSDLPNGPEPISTLDLSAATPLQQDIRRRVIEAIQTVFDPEIPVNLYDLGLIYQLDVDVEANVYIRMTLTAPACPVADKLPAQVQAKVAQVPGVHSAKVELTWSPPWSKSRMSEVALLELGLI